MLENISQLRNLPRFSVLEKELHDGVLEQDARLLRSYGLLTSPDASQCGRIVSSDFLVDNCDVIIVRFLVFDDIQNHVLDFIDQISVLLNYSGEGFLVDDEG